MRKSRPNLVDNSERFAGIAPETAQIQSFFPEPLGTALGEKVPEMGWKRALSKSMASCITAWLLDWGAVLYSSGAGFFGRPPLASNPDLSAGFSANE